MTQRYELHGDLLQPANHHPRHKMQSCRLLLFRLFEDEGDRRIGEAVLDMKDQGLQYRG